MWPGPVLNVIPPEQQCWGSRRIPQPEQWVSPLAGNNLTWFVSAWREFRPLFTQDNLLQQLVIKCDQLAAAKGPVQLTRVWLQQQPDGQESLSDWEYRTPVGCSPNTVPERWRTHFQSRRAKRLLARSDIALDIPYSEQLDQVEIGPARPPTINSVKRETQLVTYLVDSLKENLAVPTQESNSIRPSQTRYIPIFPVFKPEDTKQEDPRWCLNMKKANQSVNQRHYKNRGGHKALMEVAAHTDLMVGWDLRKMFHQFLLTPWAQAQEAFWIPEELTIRAYGELDMHPPQALRTRTIHGTRCVEWRPQGLSFGNAASPSMATDMYGLLLSWLRQRGLRIVTQVDDGRLLCRHGPVMTYAQMLLTIGIHHYFRLRIHLKESKAESLWMRTQDLFDGVILDLPTGTVFSNPKQDERHRADLRQIHTRLVERTEPQVTLREYIAVLGAQRSHQAHWPINLLVQRMSQHLGRAQSQYLAQGFSSLEIWDLPLPPIPDEVSECHRALIKPKLVGDFFRTTGPVRLTVIADTSTTGIGGQITDHASGKSYVSQNFLSPQQRQLHHTPQEAHGLTEMTLAALKHLNVRAQPNQLLPLFIGSDNVAAGVNINRPRTKSTMVDPVLPIWLEAMRRGLRPRYVRVPKQEMDHGTLCDWMGRWTPVKHPQEWGLQPVLVQEAVKALIGRPLSWSNDLDLFACRNTRQTAQFFSRWMDHRARGTDALDQSWDFPGLLYAYPPEILLNRVVSRIWNEGLTAIVVCPLTESKANYWGEFRTMVQRAVLVPHQLTNFVLPDGTPTPNVDPTPGSTLIIAYLSPQPWIGRVTQNLRSSQIRYSQTTRQAEQVLIGKIENLGPILPTSPTDINRIGTFLGI